MQKARSHGTYPLLQLVSNRFQVLFTLLAEYFSPFPHGTCSLSVSREYLALPDGAGGFIGDFSGPRLLRIRNI